MARDFPGNVPDPSGPSATPETPASHEQPHPSSGKAPEKRKGKIRPFEGYVVAIGASAGGLDALERFFDELRADSGAAFVVIQHLSPDHKSMMDNLLARHTAMPVVMAENGMRLEADHVYLIPPGKTMTVDGTELRLVPKNPHGLSLPIDQFFTSLAAQFGKRSIGAVLSGTGSDGTRGAVAINDAGGFLLAQDPDTAKFDGMPRSVIATGLVDEIMSPEMLAGRIVRHVLNLADPEVRAPKDKKSSGGNPMERILHLLYEADGLNFAEYKPATVHRRIERRMQVRNARDLESYLELLENDRGEIHTLKRDILIPVTSFFRDPETFQTLEREAIVPIIEEERFPNPIRVWVAGCSTGEEAYTIAILFAEAFERLKRWPQIKIFATDVEQQYVDIAGAGTYSEAIANEISPERLERYFTSKGTQYVVRNEIRQNIVFARHNLLTDPPFTRMDLVSCRNTLIYFDAHAQEKALLRFQYALRPGGYLLLGSSESLGVRQRDFNATNGKHKLYCILRPVSLPLDLKSSPVATESRRGAGQSRREKVGRIRGEAIEAAQLQLLRQYTPPALLVNEDRELVHVYGDVQRYLRIPEGQASLDISKLLLGKLAPVSVALIHKAGKENARLQSEVLLVRPDTGLSEHVRLVATPVAGEVDFDRHFLLAFETAASLDGVGSDSDAVDVAAISNERIQSLERDLSATRDSLQATIEELETSNEELQATNEELMAANEELQSTNEELQSVNEELYTVNSENQERIDILNRLNADLDNMMRAALIPTVFVDDMLRLTRFTPEAGSIFRIRDSDVGRPIDDFAHNMDYPEFLADLKRTLETAQLIEREVKVADGRWFLVRLLPYIDRPRNIGGAVVTLFEVTTLKDAQRLQAILDSLPEHIAVLDGQGRITRVNKAWRQFAEANGDRGLARTGPGANYLDACRTESGPDFEAAEAVRHGIGRVLSGEEETFSMTYPCHSLNERRWFLMHAAPIRHPPGGAVVSHVNVTAWIEGRSDEA
jgi:two-component system CheB/CheR fusion protein